MLLLLDTLHGYQELGIRWKRGSSCYWTPCRDIRSWGSGGRGNAPPPGHPAGISGAWDQVGEGVLLLLDTLQGYQELGIKSEKDCSCSWTPSRDIRSLGSGGRGCALAPGHPPGISGAWDQVGEGVLLLLDMHPTGISGAWDQVGEGVLLLLDTLQGYQELRIRWERDAHALGHPPGIS